MQSNDRTPGDGQPTSWIPEYADYAVYNSMVLMGNNLIFGGSFSYSQEQFTRKNISIFNRDTGAHF